MLRGRTVPATRDGYGPLGAYTGGAGEAPVDFRAGPPRILAHPQQAQVADCRHCRGLPCARAVRTLMTTPLYTATVRLQIDRNVAKVVEGGNVTPLEGGDFEFLRTQYELAAEPRHGRAGGLRPQARRRRRSVQADRASRCLATLRGLLQSAPTATSSERAPCRSEVQPRIVLASRTVPPVAGSRLVDVILFRSDRRRGRRRSRRPTPRPSSRSNLDKRFEANAYAKTFLEDQLKQLKLRLEESERGALEFAEREQIVVVTEKSSIAENNLASANAALGALVADRIKNEQLWTQVEAAERDQPAAAAHQQRHRRAARHGATRSSPNTRRSSRRSSRAIRPWCRSKTRSPRSIGSWRPKF